MHVFTSSTPFEPDRSYTKFAAYALLNHPDKGGGVGWREATKQLSEKGFGSYRGETGGIAVVTSIADVHEEPVEWLWSERIPYGNLTIVAGDPGLGKSTIVLDLMARVTMGHKMPFTADRGDPQSVILLTAEDGLANTVKPRLQAAGADTEKVFVIEGVREQEGEIVQLISIPDDIPTIKKIILEKNARLVIFDPMDAFLADGVNSFQNHSMRRALSPVKMLAEELGVAIIAICHLNKSRGRSALYRVGGSIANTAAARSVLLVAEDPEDETGRILAGVKSNLSRTPQSLALHLERGDKDIVAHVEWDRLSDLTNDDLIDRKPAKALQQAVEFLRNYLDSGPQPVKDIEDAAGECGISKRTLRRASEDLDIQKDHVNPPGGYWTWALPEEDAKPE